MKGARLVIEVNYEGQNGIKTVGEIVCNSAASYAFKYDDSWLADEEAFVFEPQMSDSGWYYSADGLFPFMRDCMPDRWGCRLIDRALESGDSRLLDLYRRTSSYGDLFYFLAVDVFLRAVSVNTKKRGQVSPHFLYSVSGSNLASPCSSVTIKLLCSVRRKKNM
ncbi:MAG: HipA N-terminal domain-containing protein [Synergistaceae bacterium]|nr:HipA N-terminal domain-containing protein [Synergistaceae bacterium]